MTAHGSMEVALTTKVWAIPSELEPISFTHNLLLKQEKKKKSMSILKSP